MKTSKIILSFITIIVSISSSLDIFASPQMPDYIVFNKDTIPTYNLLVEQYLQKNDRGRREQLFGLSFRDGASFNCWRGYQAIYKVENDSLFLSDIVECGSLRRNALDKNESLKKIETLFGDKLIHGKVFVDWFSGDLNFPLSNKILRWDGVFNTIYEEEKVLHISNGHILNIENVDNYVHDPKSINRKYKDKISDILFEPLKKVKWKNTDKCDCSEKYWITINELGKISKVTMVDYKTDEEITQYWERNEYRYCIKTILRALSNLKFDIIKEKGKPISENIFLEIWIDDNGEIENWTK